MKKKSPRPRLRASINRREFYSYELVIIGSISMIVMHSYSQFLDQWICSTWLVVTSSFSMPASGQIVPLWCQFPSWRHITESIKGAGKTRNDKTEFVLSTLIFRCVLASLYEVVSVRPSDGRMVGWMVTRFFFKRWKWAVLYMKIIGAVQHWHCWMCLVC